MSWVRDGLLLTLGLAAGACGGGGTWQRPAPAWVTGAENEAERTAPGARVPGRPEWVEPRPTGSRDGDNQGATPSGTGSDPAAAPRDPGVRMTGPAVDPSLIGSWQLVAIGDENARRDEDVEGSLVVNVSHLSLYIARGIGSGRPELRSVVRRYTIVGERLRMTTDHGHGIRKGDEVLLEQAGDVITLKMVWLQDGSLRLHEPQGTFLEFVPLLR